jgi:hypothetical protein
MQGSLDDPPIMIRSSRWKAALFLLIATGFVAISIWMLSDPKANRWMAWLGIIFFGFGIPVFGLRVIRPDVLMLAPDGITWRSVFRTARWRWTELQNFHPYSPTGGASKHVGFELTNSTQGRDGGLRGAARALTGGVEGSLGDGWELSASELADLLNRARARWAGRRW